MRIGFCSDLHFFLGKKSDYMDHIFDSLQYFFVYLKKENVTRVKILGDIVEYKDKIDSFVLNSILAFFREKREEGFVIDFLVGNHETLNRTNNEVNFLNVFSDGFTVYKDYTLESFGDIHIHHLPYFKDDIVREKIKDIKLKKGKNFLLTHMAFKNFDLGGGHEDIHSEIESKEIESIGFDHIYSGHFHKHQTKGKTTYISSPMMTNFGEQGEEANHGFVIADLQKNNFVFIENPHIISYRIVELTKESLLEMSKTSNVFYRVILKKKYDQDYLMKIKEKIEKTNWKVEFKFDLNSGVSSVSKMNDWSNMIVQKPEDILRSFVDSQIESLEEKKKLLEFINAN